MAGVHERIIVQGTFCLQDAISKTAIAFLADPALAEETPADFQRTHLKAINRPDGFKAATGLVEIAQVDDTGAHAFRPPHGYTERRQWVR